MKLGGRVAAAIEVLGDIEGRRRPVADALKDWGLAHRFAGAGDRAVIGNMVYDALRWRASSAWTAGEETPRALVTAMVARRWGLGTEALSAALAADPHSPEPLSEEETRRIGTADLSKAPAAVRAELPEWIVPSFERAFGDAWIGEGDGLAFRPPLDMRVNRLKADRDRVEKALDGRSHPVETVWSPDGLRIAPTVEEERHPNVQADAPFLKGWFEVQDEGSQLAALLCGGKPGEQVLDFCAGAGGKTLALAAIMGNKGQIHATDADRFRLAPIHERLRRAGARNVQVRAANTPLDDLAGRMDRVLIDAPCTGTGTWRRRPDSKWRLTERAVTERQAEQAALLDAAAAYVKPGGALIYVTCSVLPEENADQVDAFVKRRPEFSPVEPLAVIKAAFADDKAEKFADAVWIGSSGLQMTPKRTATDGFFVAMLKRG